MMILSSFFYKLKIDISKQGTSAERFILKKKIDKKGGIN